MTGLIQFDRRSRGRATGLPIIFFALIVGIMTLVSTVSLAGIQPAVAKEVARAETHVVEIRQFKFYPAQLRVKPGDTIVWKNLDIAPHTATSAKWDSGNLNKNQSWTLEVTEKGTIEYICAYHPAMKGTIISS